MRDPDCVALLQWALPRMDLHWPGFRKVRDIVCKRVDRRRRALGFATLAAYRGHLCANPGEWETLRALCSIPISRFYRDRRVFEALEHTVLPALAAAAAERGGTLECWRRRSPRGQARAPCSARRPSRLTPGFDRRQPGATATRYCELGCGPRRRTIDGLVRQAGSRRRLERTHMVERIQLPAPDEIGGVSLALALGRRRSRREFTTQGLDWSQIGQLLWAAQGISDEAGRLRTAPSAGALYPLEIDAAVASGLYRYRSAGHTLMRRDARDLRFALARAALGESWMAAAPCVFSISAVPSRTTGEYGNRGARYVQMEAGHAAQNLLLAAVSLGLDGVPVGAFSDEDLERVLQLAPGEVPLYLIPVGWPRASR